MERREMRGGSVKLIDIIAEAGADPDRLAMLTAQGADYEQLGFPSQGLAKKLSERGILRSNGRYFKKAQQEAGRKGVRLRTTWVPGCYFDRWLADYSLNRMKYRARHELPLEASPELQARFNNFLNRGRTGQKQLSESGDAHLPG